MSITITLSDAATGTPIASGIELDGLSESALLNDLAGRDAIAGWVSGMVRGKVDSCIERMAQEALDLLRSGEMTLSDVADLQPATLAAALIALPGYQDRAMRDALE